MYRYLNCRYAMIQLINDNLAMDVCSICGDAVGRSLVFRVASHGYHWLVWHNTLTFFCQQPVIKQPLTFKSCGLNYSASNTLNCIVNTIAESDKNSEDLLCKVCIIMTLKLLWLSEKIITSWYAITSVIDCK